MPKKAIHPCQKQSVEQKSKKLKKAHQKLGYTR
jgi:hypothetical protein